MGKYNHTMVWTYFFSNFLSLPVVIFPEAQYFQIMPNFEDFQQLKSWKRQGAGAPTKFYKSNKENISCPIAVYSRKLWKSKTNFEHWKFMKSHQSSQYWEIIRKVSIGKQVVTVTNIRQDIFKNWKTVVQSYVHAFGFFLAKIKLQTKAASKAQLKNFEKNHSVLHSSD